jgi:HSP20 family molecular chaperone IbpA
LLFAADMEQRVLMNQCRLCRNWEIVYWSRPEVPFQVPVVHAYESGDEVVAKAGLPRPSNDDIEVNVTGATLKGQREQKHDVKERDEYHSEPRLEPSYGPSGSPRASWPTAN